MDVVFECLQDGKRYYGVWRNGLQLFVGTKDECARYLEVHMAKVATERADAARPQRGRPVRIRTYRAARLQA